MTARPYQSKFFIIECPFIKSYISFLIQTLLRTAKMASSSLFASSFHYILTWLSRVGTTATKDNLLLVLIVSAFTLYLWIIFSFKGRRGSPPPGPAGLPFVGSLPFLDPELHVYFSNLARKYGHVVKIMLGGKPGILITSPSAAREVLKDNDTIFANRDVPAAGRAATYGGKDIVWTPYGPEWRMLRKVCVLKMLSNTTLDSVYGLRRREVREMVRYYYERAGSTVNVGEQMFLTILNVVTGMMWGGTVEGEARANLGAEFRQLISDCTALLGKPNVSDFFPALARFDLQGIVKQMEPVARRLDKMIEEVIEKRMDMEKDDGTVGVEAKGQGGARGSKDFLQFLLKVKDEEDAKTPLTMVGIKALLMDMVVGGTDTSSNAIEFAMAEVMNNPQVLAKVQQELDEVIGKDNIVEESHIGQLPYLYAVMKESLRLHPALPLMVPHCPSEDSVIGGYSIPKGSRVFVNVWAIQRDPALWENPDEFDPGRFLRGSKNGDYSGNDFTYFPFGSGRRICAGIAMAERMVLYSLATMFHSFDWKLPDGKKMDLSEQFGIVLKKKIPLTAIPTPRLPDQKLYE